MSLANAVGNYTPNAFLSEMFLEADLDGDGVISAEEWHAYHTGPSLNLRQLSAAPEAPKTSPDLTKSKHCAAEG